MFGIFSITLCDRYRSTQHWHQKINKPVTSPTQIYIFLSSMLVSRKVRNCLAMEIPGNSPATPYISATAVRKLAVNCGASCGKS